MLPRPPSSTLFPYTTLFRSLVQSAGRAVAGHDDPVPVSISKHAFCGVQPQVALAAALFGAMAGKAGVRENGANVAVEVYRFLWWVRRRLPGTQRREAQHYCGGRKPSADDRSHQGPSSTD